MSIVTGRRLQRFWQKGIQPLKDLLGSHDIADLSEDGTVTGALSKLNTDMRKERTFTAWKTMVFARGDGRYVSMFIPGAFVARVGATLESDAPIKISPYGQEITLTNPTITQDDTGISIISDLGAVEFGTTEACLLISTFTIR